MKGVKSSLTWREVEEGPRLRGFGPKKGLAFGLRVVSPEGGTAVREEGREGMDAEGAAAARTAGEDAFDAPGVKDAAAAFGLKTKAPAVALSFVVGALAEMEGETDGEGAVTEGGAGEEFD